MSRNDNSSLISAIYAATLSPRGFDEAFDILDDLLFARDETPPGEDDDASPPENGPQRQSVEEILPHIELARSIQLRVGREKTLEARLSAILELVPNPSWFIDSAGTVIAANELASARFRGKVKRLEDCVADKNAAERIHAFIAGQKSAAEAEDLLVVAGYADVARDVRTSILVKRAARDLVNGAPGELFLLTIIDFGFDWRVKELFRDAYGLTEAEAHVAVLLASGHGRPEIADLRGVSLDTINTQVKTLKNKTSVRDMPALVRLLCGFSAGLLAPTADKGAAKGNRPVELRTRRNMVLRDGRRLEYLEQGAADGQPVLLFHNLPYGAELPAAAIRRARRDGLRFIAPFRPGNNGSDLADNSDGDRFLDTVAGDTAELLDHLDVPQALVVSHSVGSTFALRFAMRHPDRVTGIVCVSRAPIWRDAWFGRVPRRHRFVMRLARYMPQLLPLVAWSIISYLERGHATEFMTYACRDGKADAGAATDPEIFDLVTRGTLEGLAQGTDNFCREACLSLRDFTQQAKVAPHKLHILHGDDDHMVPLEQSRTFAGEVPGTELEVVEGAGQFLFYTHWPRVLDAVEAKLQQREPVPALSD